jgi:hypothetical protein
MDWSMEYHLAASRMAKLVRGKRGANKLMHGACVQLRIEARGAK